MTDKRKPLKGAATSIGSKGPSLPSWFPRKRNGVMIKERPVIAPPPKKINPVPDPQSKRSKRRRSRGFVSLEKSSRKHRRAANRQFGKRVTLRYH